MKTLSVAGHACVLDPVGEGDMVEADFSHSFMAERIPCSNPDCANTILPDTAERTGGLCMPCVGEIAKAEEAEFIRKNRRDVNEFEGVTDPVEVLKIIHKPRKHDPLVNWIPHPKQCDDLYTELSPADQERMADHAFELIGTERHGDAEDILLSLSAFTEANLDDCLRALVTRDKIWPSMPFHRAPADVRDMLIEKVEIDAENRNPILLALAWIKDEVVVNLFHSWRENPPAWRETLYIAPENYSYEAGWEPKGGGGYRDLYFRGATELGAGPSAEPEGFRAIMDREDCCPWCSAKLINLVEVSSANLGLAADELPSRLQVSTCFVCTLFGTVFSSVGEEGHARWSEKNTRPDYLPDDSGGWDRLPIDCFTLGKARNPFHAAHQYLPTRFSQLGGHPAWVQDAEYPKCAECQRTMMFLAQIDHGDIERYGDGTYYAFLCPDCRVTATGYQQT